ncbi:MAG: hypothetical protein WC635_03050 [Bacteriovorax sp.]|jgi:hypothetical protein
MKLIKSALLSLMVCLFSLSAFASSQFEIIDANNSSDAIKYPEIIARASSGGDFVGNGGDPLKLRYAIYYFYLKKQVRINDLSTLVSPKNIYSYSDTTKSSLIVFFNKKIFIPDYLYQDYASIKDIVAALFSYQRAEVKSLYFVNDANTRNILTYLENAEGFSTVLDFDINLSRSIRGVLSYLSSPSRFRNNREATLRIPRIKFVYGKITDNFGSAVCGKKIDAETLEINVPCINSLSANGQQLFYAHELFRIMQLNDDDYSLTLNFAMSEFFDEKFDSADYWMVDLRV